MDDPMTGALELTLLGLSVVFVFLGVLVVALSVMSRTIRWLTPEAPPEPPRRAARAEADTIDPAVRRAIELAIAQHRARHGR